MKKLLLASIASLVIFAAPSLALAFDVDFVNATSTGNTSTFNGHVSLLQSLVLGVAGLVNGFILGSSATTSDTSGSSLTIGTGAPIGTGNAGDLALNGASADANGKGGDLLLTAGNGGSTSGAGGDINLNAGYASGSVGPSYAGSIQLTAGTASGSGRNGGVALGDGSGQDWFIVGGTAQALTIGSDLPAFSSDGANHFAFLDNGEFTANHTFTFPDYAGTLGLLEANQTWSGTNTFSKGSGTTTIVNFGKMGDATSHVCYNTKNTTGDDISFYFVGTKMKVDNHPCNP